MNPNVKRRLFTLAGSTRRDPAVAKCAAAYSGELGTIAKHWFDVIRGCGNDVRELMHDAHPTACVAGAAFAYVAVFKAHVTVGFFDGSALPDPGHLLEGTGRFMRHVKLTAAADIDESAVSELIHTAYAEAKLAAGMAEDGAQDAGR